jgi:hypothetical protein
VRITGPFPSPLAAAILAGMRGGFTSQEFIGRANELSRLEAVLDRADQGRPQIVLLAGEAGVGKTRLLVEFAEQARRRGVRVLTGGCVDLGDIGLAYLPVVAALQGLADDPDEAELLAEVAATAPGLGRLLPGIQHAGPAVAQASDGLDQLQVFDAVRALLVGLAERSPVVVLLEDLHWADRATRDLVAFLARTLRRGRVTLVASYRSDELHRRHQLRPLLAELARLPGSSDWNLPRSAAPSWPSSWRRLQGSGYRPTRSSGSTPARRVTRSTPSSCWPPASAMTTSGCRRPWLTCCWPGFRCSLSRLSRCCGWRRWPAGGCPTGCSLRSPDGPRPTLRGACVRRSALACW